MKKDEIKITNLSEKSLKGFLDKEPEIYSVKDARPEGKNLEKDSPALSIVIQISPKTFGGSDDYQFREKVRDDILAKIGSWEQKPIDNPSVILKFGLHPNRLANGKNDLDNLAKLVLDALSIEIKAKRTVWNGVGVIRDDCEITNLFLAKRSATEEYIKILIFPATMEADFNNFVSSEMSK
jgi:hypothetical protein